jgi:hypothetical protein
MKRLGLRCVEMASGQLAWYMPTKFLEFDRVEYLDDEGKKRRKSLVGWSERRKVFWHFAVEAKPVLTGTPHLLLKQHVIFTPDGEVPIDSKESMHLLRRRFCKSWWNDRWRDLLVAFVTWLSQKDGCQLAVGRNASFQVDDKLMSLLSPVSTSADQSLLTASYDEEDQLDTLDEDDTIDEEVEGLSESKEKGAEE